MISTMFGWFWLIANLAVLWLALTRKPPLFIRTLLVVGTLFGAAAGFCNALVMTANDWRMPVELHVDWGDAPAIISDPEDVDSSFCRAYRTYEAPSDPWRDHDVHVHVPTPPKPGDPPKSDDEKEFIPKFAFLDDRHPFRVCGETTLFSKGDIMGVLGVLLAGPGVLLVILGFIWRKIRRK